MANCIIKCIIIINKNYSDSNFPSLLCMRYKCFFETNYLNCKRLINESSQPHTRRASSVRSLKAVCMLFENLLFWQSLLRWLLFSTVTRAPSG